MRSIHGESISAKGCRKRCDDLHSAFQQDSVASLRASRTDEQYAERDQLLQDLADMIEAEQCKRRANKDDKSKKEDRREMDGHAICDAAAEGLKRKTVEDSTDDADDEGAKKTQLKKELRSSTSTSVKDSKNALAKFASLS
ncbi:hypothetical protein H310_14898 [Aphanomyces invadans]|uniref:Uncharacterized protein n=1 Tax=Aphanomyces invadans TaxID=157072 RepID=A0A024T8F1_9STRA|nr:hypothetical protein H310_14898 [Aphanomyces invadans]ETV90283.1 hypothetical protein H310_14898 [Aphanomyces invadans]|eukprot:XP_008881084.1 hypothetical protein H310_14898 [Aphanomyces invadans]